MTSRQSADATLVLAPAPRAKPLESTASAARDLAGRLAEGSLPLPDLLAETESLRLDPAEAHQLLTFAFASGSPASAFERFLASMRLPESRWSPKAFAEDLFVGDVIAQAMKVIAAGRTYPIDRAQLERTLCHPPAARSTLEFRQAIARELDETRALRADLERLYDALQRMRGQLESAPVSRRLDAHRRRLDILSALKEALDLAAAGFAGTRSGLGRIRGFGAAVVESSSYARLADLLEYEDQMAVLDLRMRIGRDGRVRGLELLAAEENEKNRFYASPLGRLWTKILLSLRGYRVGESEAMARVLDSVFEGLEPAIVILLQLQSDIEFHLAGLALGDLARKNGLAVCLPTFIDESSSEDPSDARSPGRELRGLFNPLLLASGQRVVPCDFVTERHRTTVIVTGPNSGGKTRLLQSIALVQLLGQAGLFVPAASARLLWARGLYVSLIERVEPDQTEGRLGTELMRIRSLFETLPVGAMVVVDELCSGTNPSEGEEMFELVVSLLAELEPQAFITTHFLHLAAKLARTPPVAALDFVQVELDENQWPTYRFVPGVAETSLANRTAARLGVTRDELLALVRQSKAAGAKKPC